ncbi:site-specific DNA-methyltransferase [Kibdelosporangium philippinense]|uniref:Site-specific DNA-methyltransferase n=1 Tax=Kibdelosporangium philippinense TaxID=211113 RepID=A0ABS8ZKT5_9PSEU|nr:site-specific DNA-methyltransferase [Kibdelosporangium philippinense]MCE7007068.1 site-specific DNA-methyltransferase [Kibdelosporangium philippinense]
MTRNSRRPIRWAVPVPAPGAPRRRSVRLSVWTTGQRDRSAQLRDRGYVPDTGTDLEQIPPAVAAHAIAHYSRSGGLVVDPDCGAGTVPTEALRSGRHAVGMTADTQWWRVARANLTAAKHAGAWTDGSVLDTSPHRSLTAARDVGLVRRADLVLTTIRTLPLPDGRSPDPDLESAVAARVRLWSALLRPGGHAVVILRPHRSADGTLLDLPTAVLDAAVAVGLTPLDRCVALIAGLRGTRIAPRATSTERRAADRARAAGAPTALVAHHTALILRAPDVIERRLDRSLTAWRAVRSRTDLPGHPVVLDHDRYPWGRTVA